MSSSSSRNGRYVGAYDLSPLQGSMEARRKPRESARPGSIFFGTCSAPCVYRAVDEALSLPLVHAPPRQEVHGPVEPWSVVGVRPRPPGPRTAAGTSPRRK